MSALTRPPETPFAAPDWHADVTQMLDEHHLVASSSQPRRRVSFATSLGRFLSGMRDVEVCTFFGSKIIDLETFCEQLERSLSGPMLERRVHGKGGIVSLLQSRQHFRGRAASKYRYYLWHDADVLLRHDPDLFGQLVDSLAGVAAEAEYCDDDLLLIHRSIFVGGPTLEAYADDLRGQFRSWYSDGHPEPFWQVVTGVEQPPFTSLRIDDLCA